MAVSESLSITASESNEADGISRRRAVSIAGRGSDISFIIDEGAPIDKVALELAKQLSERRGALFSEGGVSVNTGRRGLSAREKATIRKVFEENSGLTVSRFVSTIGDYVIESEEYQEEVSRRHPWRFLTRRATSKGDELSHTFPDLARGSRRNRTQAMLIQSTFRSGESIHHYGDVVVLGDANPGSEIRADGDIVVMGKLKGLAHAGASGDNKAAIIALEIASPRVRIGDHEATLQTTRKNQRGRKGGRDAETWQLSIAYTRRGAIYISPFTGRFARYTKGVLYDG